MLWLPKFIRPSLLSFPSQRSPLMVLSPCVTDSVTFHGACVVTDSVCWVNRLSLSTLFSRARPWLPIPSLRLGSIITTKLCILLLSITVSEPYPPPREVVSCAYGQGPLWEGGGTPCKTRYFRTLHEPLWLLRVKLRAVIHGSAGWLLNEVMNVWNKITTFRHNERRERVDSGERSPMLVFLPLDCVSEVVSSLPSCVP